MKSLKLAALAICIAATGFSVYAQTADEVIQKHIDAVGGAKNWEKIKSIKMTGSINQAGMDVDMSQTIVNDKGMRVDMSVNGMAGYVTCTSTEGWLYMPFAGMTEPQKIPDEQLKMSQDRLNFNNLQLADKSFIVKSSMEGKDTIDNVSCFKLKVTGKDGRELVCFIDGNTYYMVKTEAKIKIQDEEQEIAVTYGNFKKQPEGITIPMNWGSPQGDLTFKSVEINKTIDDKIFKPETK